MVSIMALSMTSAFGQIKNATTETVKIYGNCGMCEKTIENAGSSKKTASVDWDKDTKMATLTYDATKTSKDEILKKIALTGYDSDYFLAPDDVYANLHGCCQYDREAKVAVKDEKMVNMGHSDAINEKTMVHKNQKEIHLENVYAAYFELKDALVLTDRKDAASSAKKLTTSLNAVKMGELQNDVHMVWMKVMQDLKSDAQKIANTENIQEQRGYFDTLSENIYQLMKVSKTETPTYFQHCPMANDGKGANWLSKENQVKNPYYGSKMMSCGKTIETIK